MMDRPEVQSQEVHAPGQDRMQTLLLSLSELGERHGVKITPFCEQPFSRFTEVPSEVYDGIFQGFQNYYNILSSGEMEGFDIEEDSPRMAWWAFKSMGMIPPSDFFAYVNKNDVVEVYNPEFVQVFRTLNMFHLISYSLEELSTYEWWQLFHRDDAVNREMGRMAHEVISGRTRSIIHSEVPDHDVIEIFSPFRYRHRIRHKLLAPLFNKEGQMVGGASVFKRLD